MKKLPSGINRILYPQKAVLFTVPPVIFAALVYYLCRKKEREYSGIYYLRYVGILPYCFNSAAFSVHKRNKSIFKALDHGHGAWQKICRRSCTSRKYRYSAGNGG